MINIGSKHDTAWPVARALAVILFVSVLATVVYRGRFWLTQYSAATQAFAAIGVLAMTGALVWVTLQYVRLTHQLVEVAGAKQQAIRTRFQALVRALFVQVMALPEDPRTAEQIRRVSIFGDADLSNFQELSASIGEREALVATNLTHNLRWLRDRVDEVKNTPRESGYEWSRNSCEEWQIRRNHSITIVAELMGFTEDVAQLLIDGPPKMKLNDSGQQT